MATATPMKMMTDTTKKVSDDATKPTKGYFEKVVINGKTFDDPTKARAAINEITKPGGTGKIQGPDGKMYDTVEDPEGRRALSVLQNTISGKLTPAEIKTQGDRIYAQALNNPIKRNASSRN